MKRLNNLSLLKNSHNQQIHTKPRIFSQDHKIDVAFLGIVVFLAVFGLLMVYDASQFEAFRSFGDKYYYVRQQSISFFIGILALFFCTLFDYHRLEKFALPALLFSFLLLLLVFVPGLGISAYGAHRWLKVPGTTIQPAEIIKLSSVIFFAALFQKKVKTAPFVVILGLVCLIVGLFQKDLGSTIVFALVSFGMYFVAGAPILYFLGLGAASLLGAIGFILIAPYRIKRVLAFLDPFADPQGFSYHISQVLIAIGSGGFFGLGIGQSRQKFAYIPEVTTDSIFSILGEELGFAGCLFFIALLGFLIRRGFKIAQNAPDNFGKFLATGLTLWLGVQAVINLAAMVSLMPLTGVPLPFISYGGSALIANLIASGILLNISKQGNIK
jgi:cell division protein FtsW